MDKSPTIPHVQDINSVRLWLTAHVDKSNYTFMFFPYHESTETANIVRYTYSWACNSKYDADMLVLLFHNSN